MNPAIPIFTLFLPGLQAINRLEFLDLRQHYIIEPTLHHKMLFAQNGCDATFFHKDSNSQSFGKPLIHIFELYNSFALRAYGEEAVHTLKFWKEWVKHINPAWLRSAVSSEEEFVLIKSSKPLIYESNNYIPFNNCIEVSSFFTDADKPLINPEKALQSRLNGNLRTFLLNIGLDDKGMDTRFDLTAYPVIPNDYLALKTGGNAVWKKAFHVQVVTNLQLPLVFSLGQNTSYGCGCFYRKI